MEKLLHTVQENYGYSEKDIAKIRYVILTLLSEFSKLILFLIFFFFLKKEWEFFIVLLVFLPLRNICGGFHCKHYISCLLTSFFFINICIFMPRLWFPDTLTAMVILFGCLLLHYYIGPVVSVYRKEPGQEKKQQSRLQSFAYILFIIFAVFIFQMNAYSAVAFWTVLFETIELTIGYFLIQHTKAK